MESITRRSFLKLAGSAALGLALGKANILPAIAQAPVVGSKETPATPEQPGSYAKVYYTKHIDAEHLIKLYQKVNEGIYGKTAIKVHTGEQHGPYILPRDMVKAFQAQVPDSNIVETNTLYPGDRDTTEKHRRTLEVNGWNFCPVDIMDEKGNVMMPVRKGLHFSEVSLGRNITNYDSMIVLTHFKGHAMGGYGGSLKNIAIGCADGQVGKRQIHAFHESRVPIGSDWSDNMVLEEGFMENMADCGKAICDYFGKHIVFLNVLRAMSVDCDCAGTSAAKPVIPDLGMMASTDILAIDQASVDMVYAQPEKDKHDLVERIESRHGLHQLTAMRKLKMGNDKYQLISID
ncbi:MAG: DUF362 domain-containing protein [Megasphaera massiliensis]|jgi:uncharacterized Fe-S center protein|uniref:DUF362 domain-containing protein n=1 Tax=Megasphaera massiliensis TaxID=1232428 RepID=UPI002A758E6F|nr:DUF362 domain-containing protein [Megasphaera massiliensis]MDY2965803.1 DUF362 domain-containing protein [Megasphaera massiliensis]